MERINLYLSNFDLPIYCQKDNEYHKTLNNKLNEYLAHIEKKLKKTQKISEITTKEIIEELENNIYLIINSIDNYYNANFSAAKNNIMDILKKYEKNNNFIISNINKSYAFRSLEPFPELKLSLQNEIKSNYNQEYPLNFFKARDWDDELCFKDMLHIPLNSREKASTNRFSMPGIPCIYLATTSYCCWLELDMPNKNNFYVSSLRIPTDLKVLNLCISQGLINGFSIYDNEKQLNLLKQIIVIWPLVCASSFSIVQKNREFKSEYIISQLIMQCALEMGIDSIAYLSKKISDSYSYPQCVNLAIPIKKDNSIEVKKDNGEKEIYWEHSLKTQITDPVLFSKFLNKPYESLQLKSYINHEYNFYNNLGIEDYNDLTIMLEQVLHYSDSKFSQFDDYLVNQKHNNLNLK